MSSSKPELVRAYASFKLWKAVQQQDRDLRMIVGHFSVLAGIETTLETRIERACKTSAPHSRPPPPNYLQAATCEESCQHVEVAVVEMDDADDCLDDDSADDSSDDNDDAVEITKEPIDETTVQQEPSASEVDTLDE